MISNMTRPRGTSLIHSIASLLWLAALSLTLVLLAPLPIQTTTKTGITTSALATKTKGRETMNKKKWTNDENKKEHRPQPPLELIGKGALTDDKSSSPFSQLTTTTNAATSNSNSASSDGSSSSSSSGSSDSASDKISTKGAICLATVIALLISLYLNLVKCSAAMFVATLFLLLCGVIDSTAFIAGLSNSAVTEIGLLFICMAPISELPLVHRLVRYAVSRVDCWPSLFLPRLKVGVLTMALAWFIHNNPLVAMMTPLIKSACSQVGVSPAQFLMPMNAAKLIASTFALTGTSTNNIYSGLMEEYGMGSMSFFEMIKVSGVPGVLTLIYLAIAPQYLLPHHTTGLLRSVRGQQTSGANNNFIAHLSVAPSSPLIGLRVEAIARMLPNAIKRDTMLAQVIVATSGDKIPQPEPSVGPIAAGDIFVFTGAIEALKNYASILHLEWVPLEATSTETAPSTPVRTPLSDLTSPTLTSPNIPAAADAGPSPPQQSGNFPPPTSATAAAAAATPLPTPPPPGDADGSTTAIEMNEQPGGFPLPPVPPSSNNRTRTNHCNTIRIVDGAQEPLLTGSNPLYVPPPIDLTGGGVAAGSSTTDSERSGSSSSGSGDGGSAKEKDDDDDELFASPEETELVFIECVIGPQNPVVGRTAGSGAFQRRYRVPILAFRKAGRVEIVREADSLGEWVIEVGDTLLVLGTRRAISNYENDFLVWTAAEPHRAEGQQPQVVEEHYVTVPWWFPWGQPFDREMAVTTDARTKRLTSGFGADDLEERGGALRDGSTSSSSSSSHGGDDRKRSVNKEDHDKNGSGSERFWCSRFSRSSASKRDKLFRIPFWYPYLSVLIFAAMIAITIAGYDFVMCVSVTTVVLITFKFITLQRAFKELDLDILIMVAFSFGLGTGMQDSGLANVIGTAIEKTDLSGFPLLLLISAVTTLVANVITSKACTQVLFPIVHDVFAGAGKDPLPGVMVLAVVTNCAFSTPYGNSTNLMIMGPGGYVALDYLKLGLPLNIIIMVTAALMGSIAYGYW